MNPALARRAWLAACACLIALILLGLAGTILPALPGLPLVFAGMLLAAWAGGFQEIGWVPLVILGLMTAFSFVIDFWATAHGAKRVGASRKALVGAVLGTFAGLFFAPKRGSELLTEVKDKARTMINKQQTMQPTNALTSDMPVRA